MSFLDNAADLAGWPQPVDDYMRELILSGYTDEEAIEEACLKIWLKTSANRRWWMARAAAIRGQTDAKPAFAPGPAEAKVASPTRSGPPQATTEQAVEKARSDLVDEDLPSGERSIAKRLGVTRGAVRYALGKDRD